MISILFVIQFAKTVADVLRSVEHLAHFCCGDIVGINDDRVAKPQIFLITGLPDGRIVFLRDNRNDIDLMGNSVLYYLPHPLSGLATLR